MQFDNIFGNPPFQDNVNRKKTQHKLWLQFTEEALNSWLKPGGSLCWITPQSWGSPSSKILQLFKKYDVKQISLDTKQHFPDIGSTFSHYCVDKKKTSGPTLFKNHNQTFSLKLDKNVLYIPNDFCDKSISIHKKVMFDTTKKYELHYDYVTCHNVIRHAKKLNQKKINQSCEKLKNLSDPKKAKKTCDIIISLIEKQPKIDITISETKTKKHIHPVFHTNNKVWYSSIKQSFADKKKVMWSRSGYTKPFYDNGTMGCTDMGYYILVNDDKEGKTLESFLTSELMTYIFKTAKWSGFGNELVFSSIPKINLSKQYTELDYYKLFKVSQTEQKYIKSIINPPKTVKKSPRSKTEIKADDRVKALGEVFTPVKLVREMLNMVGTKDWMDPSKTFIDPACGNGNFLVEILKKRLDSGIMINDALETLYGIDIMEDNIRECHSRIINLLKSLGLSYEIDEVKRIMKANIVVNNSLAKEMKDIFLTNRSE